MYQVKNQKVFAMSKDNAPALTVESGATIQFITNDCFDNQITKETDPIGELNWEQINPATGPVFIQGALENQVLKVHILDIEIGDCGTMVALPKDGVLGMQIPHSQVKKIPILDGYAVFRDDLKLPCDPMIGVIGVAPKSGSIHCGEPGEHGGNMDNKKIKKGSTLYLPIFHEGALLAIGDVHACMGDGEIMVSGVEIPAKVTVQVEVIHNQSISNPRLEDDDFIYTIASDVEIEKAIYQATSDMNQIVMERCDLSFNEAGMLLSAAGDLQICQVVDPKRTVRFAMPKKLLTNSLSSYIIYT